MTAHVLHEIRWEFPNGLAGKALVFSGLEEVQTALTDAGATVSVSVATRPPAGPQTATHGREPGVNGGFVGGYWIPNA